MKYIFYFLVESRCVKCDPIQIYILGSDMKGYDYAPFGYMFRRSKGIIFEF